MESLNGDGYDKLADKAAIARRHHQRLAPARENCCGHCPAFTVGFSFVQA